MRDDRFNMAQLRHAWHHLDQGRTEAAKEVIASVIRGMERDESRQRPNDQNGQSLA